MLQSYLCLAYKHVHYFLIRNVVVFSHYKKTSFSFLRGHIYYFHLNVLQKKREILSEELQVNL